ncbi:MAG: putative lipoprotein, partial [Daejeonella sp.]|nr:putative lipoprotein [Daejeonella sp.]
SDIYIADIGDNKLAYNGYIIYSFPEPVATASTVKTFNTIKFTYSDGKHDAEAFLVDPKTKDILIITKNDPQSGIYKLSYPYSFTNSNRAALVGKLDYSGVVSAALSPDRKEIIIKTYTDLRLYSCTEKQSIEEALSYKSKSLPYVLEPQGEAVTFANDNSGFYTLSEKGLSTSVNLYWYKRK